MNPEDMAQALDMRKEALEGRNPLQVAERLRNQFPTAERQQALATRRKAITRFALDFLKANLDELELDGMLDAFGGEIAEDEIDALKDHLGVTFS